MPSGLVVGWHRNQSYVLRVTRSEASITASEKSVGHLKRGEKKGGEEETSSSVLMEGRIIFGVLRGTIYKYNNNWIL